MSHSIACAVGLLLYVLQQMNFAVNCSTNQITHNLKHKQIQTMSSVTQIY